MIFNGLAVLSLVLAIGVATLWVRSYWRADAISLNLADGTEPDRNDSRLTFHSWTFRSGFISGTWYHDWSSGWFVLPRTILFASEPAWEKPRRGFAYSVWPNAWTIEIDAAFIMVPLLAMPLVRATLRALKAGPPGFCRRCGYDLRATPDRCPECGQLKTQPSSPAD